MPPTPSPAYSFVPPQSRRDKLTAAQSGKSDANQILTFFLPSTPYPVLLSLSHAREIACSVRRGNESAVLIRAPLHPPHKLAPALFRDAPPVRCLDAPSGAVAGPNQSPAAAMELRADCQSANGHFLSRYAVPYPRWRPLCRATEILSHITTTTTTSRDTRTNMGARTGQGVQKVGMLTPWIEAFPATTSHIMQEMDHYAGYKLSDIIQNGPSKVLTQTTNSQPAIMATSIIILRILEKEFNFHVADHFDVALGHSLGEFSALVAGGYLSFPDSLYLVRERAAAMSRATQQAVAEHGGEYGMVAMITEPGHLPGLIDAVHAFVGHSSAYGAEAAAAAADGAGSTSTGELEVPPIEQVLIANINSKNQIVLSGSIERIHTLIAHVRQFHGHDPRAVRLASDSPFHSPIMKPAVSVVRAMLRGKSRVPGREHHDIITWPGRIESISNVTARPFRSKEELKELLARGCLETVRWWDSIRYLDKEEKIRRWVGIGPGKVGRNLVGKEVGMRGKDMVKGGGVWAITDPLEVEEVIRGLEETAYIIDDEEWEDDG